MPWSRLKFAPGVSKDITRYGSEGQWVDSNLIHFRNGYAERWGGWVRYLPDIVLRGMCRSMHRWSVLIGYVYNGLGTNSNFYVSSDDAFYDVTPILSTVTLTNPFTTTSGSAVVKVTSASHPVLVGNEIIISGATAVGGLTLSGSYTVTGYIDQDNFQITAASNATSSATGGGASVSIQYVYYAGAADQTRSDSTASGWSSGTWGEGLYGTDGGVPTADNIGLWSQDNWGEDLIANSYDGPIFYWDATFPGNRMVNIRSLPGADGNAPKGARFIAVSHQDRHLLAFGVSEEYGGTTAAPMTVRWCSQENIYNWNEADETGTAGSLPLSKGSRFLAVQPTQTEILAWSDACLYSLQFVGAPDVYVANIVASDTDIAGLNAACVYGSYVYWMGRSGFFVYDGRVQNVPSSVWDYVSRNINWTQSQKIYASSNRNQQEVIWFYPSINSLENDSYVAFDVDEQVWHLGTLARTAWMDNDFQYLPLATAPSGKMLYHDKGMDNGENDPPTPISAYIESAPIELSSEGAYDKGDRFAFLRRILPDVTFLDNDGVNTPKLNLIIKTMDKPGGGFDTSSSSQVSQTVILPVEQWTDDLHVRLRGRSITVRWESDTAGSWWRLGVTRYDIRSDGQR